MEVVGGPTIRDSMELNWLFIAASLPLRVLASLSAPSSAEAWACFQTASSTSSSATRLSSSALRFTVAEERSVWRYEVMPREARCGERTEKPSQRFIPGGGMGTRVGCD